MKFEDLKFDFDDIKLPPKTYTNIDSRQNINVFHHDQQDFLPIIAAPMDTVVGLENWEEFYSNNIPVCLPRTIKSENLSSEHNQRMLFHSYGLDEIIDILNRNLVLTSDYILIDIANGHMQKLYDTAIRFKKTYPTKKLMIGNIGNPETYRWYAETGVIDYIRVGIGNGGACCIGGTKIKTKEGIKNIENVIVGDYVLTHKNTYEKVINTFSKRSDEIITINDKISVTPDHKFYVLNKKHKNNVNDENIHNYAEWIEAKNLNDSYLLLETLVND
jgi:hypothetical protein